MINCLHFLCGNFQIFTLAWHKPDSAFTFLEELWQSSPIYHSTRWHNLEPGNSHDENDRLMALKIFPSRTTIIRTKRWIIGIIKQFVSKLTKSVLCFESQLKNDHFMSRFCNPIVRLHNNNFKIRFDVEKSGFFIMKICRRYSEV